MVVGSGEEDEEDEGDGEREDWIEGRGLAGADFRRMGGAVGLLGFLWEVVVVVGRGGLKAGGLRLGAGGMRSGGMIGGLAVKVKMRCRGTR